MTREEAANEVKKRGWKNCLLSDRHWRVPSQRFLVSNCDWICGVGDSWEAAFADADRREKEQNEPD